MQALVTTLAGIDGQQGYQNGPGSQAKFGGPLSVAVDNSGNVFVADTPFNLIRKIDTSGNVSTFAGTPPTLDENGDLIASSGYQDGPAAQALFTSPKGVAVDNSGNVYVADDFNCVIRKIDSSGNVTTVAGIAGQAGHDNGPAAQATFYHATSLVIDNLGNIFVTDWGQGCFILTAL